MHAQPITAESHTPHMLHKNSFPHLTQALYDAEEVSNSHTINFDILRVEGSKTREI